MVFVWCCRRNSKICFTSLWKHILKTGERRKLGILLVLYETTQLQDSYKRMGILQFVDEDHEITIKNYRSQPLNRHHSENFVISCSKVIICNRGMVTFCCLLTHTHTHTHMHAHTQVCEGILVRTLHWLPFIVQPNPNPNLNLNHTLTLTLKLSLNSEKSWQHSKDQPKCPFFPKMTSLCWLKTHAGPHWGANTRTHTHTHIHIHTCHNIYPCCRSLSVIW